MYDFPPEMAKMIHNFPLQQIHSVKSKSQPQLQLQPQTQSLLEPATDHLCSNQQTTTVGDAIVHATVDKTILHENMETNTTALDQDGEATDTKTEAEDQNDAIIDTNTDSKDACDARPDSASSNKRKRRKKKVM